MDILRILFGWNWRVRRLRKHWDRERERCLKLKNPLRTELLEKLDNIENSLRMLEEKKMVRYEKLRMIKEVEIDLVELQALREGKNLRKMESES